MNNHFALVTENYKNLQKYTIYIQIKWDEKNYKNKQTSEILLCTAWICNGEEKS